MTKDKPAKGRIDALDYLRGFFILVIVVDHLNRWPSALVWLTGQGALWVSAAEGFFIISGLLIGYIRGHKARHLPMKTVTATLLKRAALLYAWSVGLSIIFVLLIWNVPINTQIIPPALPEGTPWWQLLWQIITQQYVHDWIYFLRLYWMMLLVAPLAVWLLRRGKAWLLAIISIMLWLLNTQPGAEAFFQWQLLFFIPAIAGFYLETIRERVAALTPLWQRTLGFGFIAVTLVTIAVSALWIKGYNPSGLDYAALSTPARNMVQDPVQVWFSLDPLAFGRIVLAFIWFCGFFALFQYALPLIKKWVGWLLLSFGTRSLTAYSIHGFVLFAIQLFIPQSSLLVVNTLIGAVAVLAVWGLLQLTFVQRIFPR